MTVKELAAALAAMPAELQDSPVCFREEGEPISVVTIHSCWFGDDDHGMMGVLLAGWYPPDIPTLYREGQQPDGAPVVVNAPKCPRCGATMQGGAPHGPWPVQWECRACGHIVVPPAVGA